MIGRLLGGRYEVLERIGGGGMALVYRARCTYLHRIVALKVLRPQYAADEDFVRRFRREAQAAASLSHPNIVSIHDVGHDNGTHYIVMEYIDGETLKDRIRKGGLLPVDTAVRVASQICEALEHAHAHRVVHRDIKPHNILLTRESRIKVTDFGIARATSMASVTEAGTVLGSVHYFSPEQARGGFVGDKSDIYSLGVVLYEMLTGQVPFQGESPIATALKHVHDRPRSLRQLRSDIPVALENIVMKAMAKDPLQRYQSASALLADLNRFRQEITGGGAVAGAADDRLTGNHTDNGAAGAVQQRDPDAGGGADIGKSMEGKTGKVVWLKILVWLALLSVLAGGTAYGFRKFMTWLDVPVVEVPSVTGQSLVEAEKRLREAGLTWTVGAEKNDMTVPAGYVIDQHPPAGEEKKRGSAIQLVISRGPKFVEGGVPNVLNLHWREAEIKLRAAGLNVGRVSRRHHESVPEDYVVSQSPRAGTTVVEGTGVDLELSLGPPAVAMPDLTGLTREQAESRLRELGLRVGRVREETSSHPAGIVIDQSPAPWSTVEWDTGVDLVVSKGDTEDQRPGSGPGGGTAHSRDILVTVTRGGLVAVEVEDQQGKRIVHMGEHAAGESFPVRVQWHGEAARVRVYVNDQPAGRDIILEAGSG